jgi:hypothetical protein
MNRSDLIQSVSPSQLSQARATAHRAAQLLTKAARANFEPEPDDSHSSLTLDRELGMFLSWPLESQDGEMRVGLSLDPLVLIVLGESEIRMPLAGVSVESIEQLLSGILEDAGLKSINNFALPYELPADVAAVTRFEAPNEDQSLAALAAWYDVAAENLSAIVSATSDLKPGPSPVRCWPHHFDIATYVSLETGDPETARAIGIGMSPGDEGYSQPYFYVNPWPHLDADTLPPAAVPGHWHLEGYVGLIATADEIVQNGGPDGIRAFLAEALAISKTAFGD